MALSYRWIRGDRDFEFLNRGILAGAACTVIGADTEARLQRTVLCSRGLQ